MTTRPPHNLAIATAEATPSLARLTLTALKWNYAGAAVRAGSSLVIGIVLARLLGPGPFGLVAVAWLVIGLGNLVADFGLGSALVQRRTITDRDVRYAFTLQAAAGLLMTIAAALAAAPIERLFRQPGLAGVVRCLSLIFVIQGLGLTAVALLKRELRFRSLQLAEIASYLGGFLLLGIPLALNGGGAGALVAAQLCQTTLFTTLAYLSARHGVRPAWSGSSPGLFGFGAKVLLTNVVNWTIGNADTLLAGKFLGVVNLGLYDRASSLLTTPANSLASTLQKVVFPAYARAQDDPAAVRRCHVASVGFITLLAVPVYGCAALVPHAVIGGLFGGRWEAAVGLVPPVALAMPFHVAMAMGGPMLWAGSRVGGELRAQLAAAVFTCAVLSVAALVSVQALAWGVLAVSVVRFALVTSAALRATGAGWPALLRSMRGGAILFLYCGVAVLAADQLTRTATIPPVLRLATDVCAAGGAFAGAFLAAPGMLLCPEMKWLAGRVGPLMPLRVRPLIDRACPVEGALS